MIRLQQTRHALGSEVLLTLVGTERKSLAELFDMLWGEIRIFESTFSRFQEDSELSYVNSRAGLPVRASQEFIQLTECSKDMALRTGGLYNPLILPALQRAGYKGSWPSPGTFDPDLDYSHRKIAEAEMIQLTTETVQLPPDAALDFGGIGKGYLLDQLANLLAAQGCENFWLSLGGDLIVQGYDSDGGAWKVGISAAEGNGEVARVQNEKGKRLAVATSGITKRQGEGWHHLIDPRTGKPSTTDVLTATVCTEKAVEADVYAKCLVLVGSGQAETFMAQHGFTKAVLQTRDKRDTLVVDKKGIK